MSAVSLAEMLSQDCPDPSGARSSNRFAFQSSYGTCHMLKLHEAGVNYCVLFDVHDDIVSLDHPTAPTKASFFQVKTKASGNWTTHSITTGEKSASGTTLPSFLGKLYKHRLKFDVAVDRLTFVSNARFNVALADATDSKEKESIAVSELSVVELETIKGALTLEHQLTTEPEGLELIFLETTALSLNDHDNHCLGVVTAFLEKQGDGSIQPLPFHRTLKSDIQRRTNRETRDAAFSDLVKNRGLTRQQVQDMIDCVMSIKKQNDLVSLISSQFTKESFPPNQSRVLIENVRKYLAGRLDPTNRIIAEAQKMIEIELDSVSHAQLVSSTIISGVLSHCSKISCKEWQAVCQHYSTDFLNAMIVVQIYEQEFSASNSQSEEKSL
jgi:hypothetical protein